MTEEAFIEVELTLLKEEDGGRKYPLFLENEKAFYRPHIVIGSASQRQPILKPGTRQIDEEYLGVQFRPCQKTLYPGDASNLILDLMYFPTVEYYKIKKEVEFTLREGGNIIGYGRVIEVSFDS